jgi:hypothetical protein
LAEKTQGPAEQKLAIIVVSSEMQRQYTSRAITKLSP